jgi:hypothetical protein
MSDGFQEARKIVEHFLVILLEVSVEKSRKRCNPAIDILSIVRKLFPTPKKEIFTINRWIAAGRSKQWLHQNVRRVLKERCRPPPPPPSPGPPWPPGSSPPPGPPTNTIMSQANRKEARGEYAHLHNDLPFGRHPLPSTQQATQHGQVISSQSADNWTKAKRKLSQVMMSKFPAKALLPMLIFSKFV